MQKPRLTFRVHPVKKTALERYAAIARGKTVSDLVREQLEPLFNAAMKFAEKHEAKPQ